MINASKVFGKKYTAKFFNIKVQKSDFPTHTQKVIPSEKKLDKNNLLKNHAPECS